MQLTNTLASAWFQPVNPLRGDILVSKLAFHFNLYRYPMSDPTNAELLAPVMAIARPDPVPNQTFQSAWGDSLKSGPDTLRMWTETCMVGLYKLNAVHGPIA
jgi:hypothetical protein